MNKDLVKQPDHYKQHDSGIECKEIISFIKNPMLANIIKYLWRHKYKNGIIDLEKALEYSSMLCDQNLTNKTDDFICYIDKNTFKVSLEDQIIYKILTQNENEIKKNIKTDLKNLINQNKT